MKVFIVVLVCLASLVYANEWTPKTTNEIQEIRAACIKEYPLTEEQVAKMKNLELPDEEIVRKYILCASEKIGTFTPHEGYHADRIAKQFKLDMDESEVLTLAEGCIDKNEQGSPTDVWAYRGHRCLMSSKVGEKIRALIKKRQEEEEAKTQKE